jgi:hypothetical protein
MGLHGLLQGWLYLYIMLYKKGTSKKYSCRPEETSAEYDE